MQQNHPETNNVALNFSKLTNAVVFIPQEVLHTDKLMEKHLNSGSLVQFVESLGIGETDNFVVAVPDTFHSDLINILTEQARTDTLAEFLVRPLMQNLHVSVGVDPASLNHTTIVTIIGDGVQTFHDDGSLFIKGSMEDFMGGFSNVNLGDNVIVDHAIYELFTSTDHRWLGKVDYRMSTGGIPGKEPLVFPVPEKFDEKEVMKFLARRNKGMGWKEWRVALKKSMGANFEAILKLRKQFGMKAPNICYVEQNFMGATHHTFFLA